MALAALKTFIAGEILSASDLNALNTNILNNPVSLISPLTGALDFDGFTLTLDAAAATTVVSSAAVSWNFTSGAKTGTPATTGSVFNFSAQTFTDNNTAASGTATAYVGYALQRPTLAATNATVTTTDAAVFYIPNNVAAGTNQTITNSWALWVDAGNVRFDDDIYWRSGTAFNGIFAHNITAARTWTFPDTTGTVAIASEVLALSGGTLTGPVTFIATQQFKAPTVQIFTASGTYTRPAGLSAAVIEVVGGGGGGGGSSNNLSGGGGGGAGGYARLLATAATVGASQTVTIGAAGAGGAAGQNNGASGGTTSFGAIISATGGAGGTGVGAGGLGDGGLGGAGSGGDFNSTADAGGVPYAGAAQRGGKGGNSVYGGGGRPEPDAAGSVGSPYGAGGAGGGSNVTNRAGGAGSAGIIIVTEFY